MVEDYSYNSIAIKCMLQQYQLESEDATDGQEAFDKIKERYEQDQSTYSLILMDFSMPILNGADSTVMIRRYLKE